MIGFLGLCASQWVLPSGDEPLVQLVVGGSGLGAVGQVLPEGAVLELLPVFSVEHRSASCAGGMFWNVLC